MKPRQIGPMVPLVAVAALAVTLSGRSEAVNALVVAGFAYAAIVVLVVARRRWPPQSPMISGELPGRASDQGDQTPPEPLESAIVLSGSSAADYERRLRPILFRVAVGRLRARGVIAEEDPEEAETLLGAPVWQLIRPPESRRERNAPGVSLEEIEEIVARIEEV